MKICKRCGVEKSLDDFYIHKMMSDGYLNICKICKKEEAKNNHFKNSQDKNWCEKEKLRGREKYYKLGYKEKYKRSYEDKKQDISNYKQKYPEKYLAHCSSSQLIPKIKGNHLHHWSYNKEHWKDVIELSIEDHNLLHRNMIYDQERMMYRNLNGILLDTRESHYDYYLSLIY